MKNRCGPSLFELYGFVLLAFELLRQIIKWQIKHPALLRPGEYRRQQLLNFSLKSAWFVSPKWVYPTWIIVFLISSSTIYLIFCHPIFLFPSFRCLFLLFSSLSFGFFVCFVITNIQIHNTIQNNARQHPTTPHIHSSNDSSRIFLFRLWLLDRGLFR